MATYTTAIHSPIYPMPNEEVSFYLNKISGNITEVRLYEIVYDIDDNGDPKIDPLKPRVPLNNWLNPKFPLIFRRKDGYGERKYVNYIFEICCSSKSNNYQHSISFATHPFNKEGAKQEDCKPVPIYIVANRDYAMNCVFIQDNDMVNVLKHGIKDTANYRKFFDNTLTSIINYTVLQEDFLKRFRSSYNFYFNPPELKRQDVGIPNSRISYNEDNLSFAQIKMNLHGENYRDWTLRLPDEVVSSMEFYSFGAFLHESGHGFYNLQDEYDDISDIRIDHSPRHPFPNNWRKLDEIKKAAKDYQLPESCISTIRDGIWKLCNENCIMNKSGSFISSYDLACKLQILNTLYTRAKYSGNCMALIKSENKVIKKFNKHMEKEKFRYDVNYSSHFGFTVSWNSADNKYEIKNFKERPGALPYNKNQDSNKTITYSNKKKSEVFSLPHYLHNFYNRNKQNNKKKYFDVKEDFELLMPKDEDIQQIDIKINEEKITLVLSDYIDAIGNLLLLK